MIEDEEQKILDMGRVRRCGRVQHSDKVEWEWEGVGGCG